MKMDDTNSVLVYEGPSMEAAVKALGPYLVEKGIISSDNNGLKVSSVQSSIKIKKSPSADNRTAKG